MAPILRRFRVVGIDDLPPAPQRQRVTGGSNGDIQRADPDVLVNESQFAAEIVAEEVFMKTFFFNKMLSLEFFQSLTTDTGAG